MIRVINEPDIYVSGEALNRYRQEYKSFCAYHVSPPSFEEYVKRQEKRQGRKRKIEWP